MAKRRNPPAPPPPSKLRLRMAECGVSTQALLVELRAAIPLAEYGPMHVSRWGAGAPVRTPVAAWLCARLDASAHDLGLVLRRCPSDHPLVVWLWTQTGADWPPAVKDWAQRLELSVNQLSLLRCGWQRKERKNKRRPNATAIRQDLVERLVALGAPDPGELEIAGLRVHWRTLCADW